MAASNVCPIVAAAVSLFCDIGFLGQMPFFERALEGRLQRPSPFLIRSLPGRERVRG